jgi:hypothetical protein
MRRVISGNDSRRCALLNNHWYDGRVFQFCTKRRRVGILGKFFCFIVVIFSVLADAESAERDVAFSSRRPAYSLDVGLYAGNLTQWISAPSGLGGEVLSLGGFLRFRPGFHLAKRWRLEPSLGIVIPWRRGADGSTEVFTFQWDLDLAFAMTRMLRLRVGPGISSQLLISSGGPVQLNNGTSTSTFYTPSQILLTALVSIQTGLEFQFASRWSTNFDLIFVDLLSSSRRTINGLVTLGVRL